MSPAAEIIKQAPAESLTSDQLEGQIQGLSSWYASVSGLQARSTEINSFVAISEAVTNTAVSGVMLAWPRFPTGQPRPQSVEESKVTLFHTIERFPLVDRALAALRRLGLDSRGGSAKTPVALLEEARNALQRPVHEDGSAVSVLIALRECVDASITELIRRRPKQEAVSGGWKGKVASLGQQCARPLLSASHFDRVGIEIDAIMNELSGTKQAEMPRARLLELFYRGVLSLNALLDSIDESNLRPS